MISFSKIMRQVLTEKMSFRDLYHVSDPGRVDRSRHVRAKSLQVTSMGNNEAWTFTYKSSPSTTGHRWHGYVRFLKEDVSQKDRVDELDCMVDCDCPDYRFKWAYNNAAQGAGALGQEAWNDNNGRPPRPREHGGVGDDGPGMCKHLIALGEFLKTKIEPEAPEPDEPQVAPEPKKIVKQKPQEPSLSSTKQTMDAPDPDDEKDSSYSDSREDGYSDSRDGTLQEGKGQVAEKLNSLVHATPNFDVPYED